MDLGTKTGELASFSFCGVGREGSWWSKDLAADTVCSLSWIWQTSDTARRLRQLCCLNICSLSPSERGAGSTREQCLTGQISLQVAC